MSLDLLRAAQAVSADTAEPGLPPDRMRFSLEYPAEPDLAAERARLTELLGGPNFQLEPLDELLPNYLVLQFPGVERRMAPESLFEAADALVDALGLVSATPDVGTSFVVAPDDPNRTEGVAEEVLNLTCWATETLLPRDWAVKAVNAPAAWARGFDGRGVLIAQPDTGVAIHAELDGALDLARGFNVLTNTADPTDPVSDRMGSPGHGTSTASAAAARGAGKVMGAAPGATVAPIRCINNVVLRLDGTPVARAILHAVRIRADVISMSLGGGQQFPAIAAALREAAAAGIVVVAAAGNCVQPIVVYPARDPNAIALAGVDTNGRPWKGTSQGARVAVGAPAENVLVARRSPDDGGEQRVKPSQGTSYATAITAGLAAIWVQKHGRQAIREHARRCRCSVNDLFRTVLKHSARRPVDWPAQGMGTGIPDAVALIDFDLGLIGRPATPEAAPSMPGDAILAALEESYDGIESGQGDWPRVGAESVFLLWDAWMRENRAAAIPVESPAKPEPSPGLRARMPPAVRAGLAAAEPGPVMLHPTIGATGRAPDFARHLAAGAPSGTESSAMLSPEAARGRIRNPDTAARLVDRAARTFGALDRRGLGDSAARGEVMRRAEGVIRRAGEGRLDDLDLPERVTLEALVRLNDRPAYRLMPDGSIDPDDPLFGEWGGFLSLLVDLAEWTRSVGRINLGGTHVGTGFLIAGDRVMTNRHVLEALADEIAGPGGRTWRLRGAVTIDFSETADGSRSFALDRVLQTGPDPINGRENLAHLDMAVLGLAPGAQGLPRVLPLAREIDTSATMLVIGFPARPGTSSLVDPATGRVSQEIGNRLREIFGTEYGRKYASPGHVIDGPGALPTDLRQWATSHDCTTLGGNSGSVVVQFTGTPAVAGLHFSGAPLTANKAHVLGRVETGPLGPIAGATWI